MSDILWNNDSPISDITSDIDIPPWINQGIAPYNIAGIVRGGCASGAYMPAVTYHQALATMADHGDAVLQFIEDNLGELPKPPDDISWSGLACHYLSCAVELWASSIEDELMEIIEATDEEEV